VAVGVLDGYRVLDLSIAMSGPFATMRLGDLGADVIKVEPVTGEWQRHVSAGGAKGSRVNVSFLSLNRNKRSLAVNLKSPDGRRLVHELARTADVFLQNYRPGVAARLGMDYETIRGFSPRIVYVSISGYGETGPYAGRPGQDLILQGMSGAMFSAGRRSDLPQPAIVTLQMQEMSVFTVGGLAQQRSAQPHAHCFIRAPYGAFATAEGYLILAFPPLARLGEVLSIPELGEMDDEVDGHARRDEIHALVAARLLDRPAGDWLELFAEHGIWAGPVYSYLDVVNDPQVRHNGTLVSYRHPTEGEVTTPGFAIRFTRSPSSVRQGAPLAGEHTREILAGLGLSGQQVDDLLAAGVVGAEQP
jgi:crotonobetainyl-CoA:carnitine CoA-transferase CaiB-like acyl-CoA transferase